MHIYIHNMHKQMHTLKILRNNCVELFGLSQKNSLKSCTKIYAY